MLEAGHVAYLETVPLRTIAAFTALQVALLLLVYVRPHYLLLVTDRQNDQANDAELAASAKKCIVELKCTWYIHCFWTMLGTLSASLTGLAHHFCSNTRHRLHALMALRITWICACENAGDYMDPGRGVPLPNSYHAPRASAPVCIAQGAPHSDD